MDASHGLTLAETYSDAVTTDFITSERR